MTLHDIGFTNENIEKYMRRLDYLRYEIQKENQKMGD